MEVQNNSSFLFPNVNTRQEPRDVLGTERYLSLTISPLGSITDPFCSFRSIYGQTRGFIHLFYNCKNYSVSSSSCPRAMTVSSSPLKHGLTMWRAHIGVRIVGQFNIFMRYWSTGKWLQIISQLFCSCSYTGSKCLHHLDALKGIALAPFFHLLWICTFISHISSVGLALWF